MRTVELLPDPVTEARVRRVWQELAAAGLPSLAGHRHPTNRPHLTLATADGPPRAAWRELPAVLAVLPLPLRLEGAIRFSGRTRVLAWRVVPDAELAALHRRVGELLHGHGTGSGGPPPAPGFWSPHITLGRTRSDRARWPDGLLPAELSEPWEGAFTAARSYDTATRTVEPLGAPDSASPEPSPGPPGPPDDPHANRWGIP
ncbi:2'-5' RNA ligase family protein [Streptomyces sp. NPDC006193]|uniref:2'-5' RNA ligase family protein n=1 Tax=Streptomyces sp. NPDC006193 TaxID=3155717 RepID=UPI0033B3348F